MNIKKRTRYDLRSSKELLLEPPLVMTKKTLGDKVVAASSSTSWGQLWGLYSSRFFMNDTPKVISRETSFPLFADDFKCFRLILG